jgi:hypothetical protein
MFEAMVYILRVGCPMARPADALWIMEFSLYPLAALV